MNTNTRLYNAKSFPEAVKYEKVLYFFHIVAQNINCGLKLEPPRIIVLMNQSYGNGWR